MNPGEDTSAVLWSAIWRLAEVWSRTPLVHDIASTVPRNLPWDERGDKATGVSALLQYLEVNASTLVKPMMYASRISALLGYPSIAHFGMPEVDKDELNKWLWKATGLESAHLITLGWLRSSLAGYPLLRAPQLAPGTPLTTEGMTPRHIWRKEEFGLGLNHRSAPPSVPKLLGADARVGLELDQAARDVSQALAESQAWLDFELAVAGLDDAAKKTLRAARRELRERLSAEALDDHEPDLALQRAEYRSHVMSEVLGSLSGSALNYANAFGEVDRLLNLIMGDIFGELVLFHGPGRIEVFNVETPRPGEPIVGFETKPVGPFVALGQILWLKTEAITDAVRIEQHTMTMDQAEGVRDRFQARVLLNTGEAWPASNIEMSI